MPLRKLLLVAFALALASFAILKFSGAYRDSFDISREIYYLSALLELGISVLLFTPYRPLGLTLSVLFFGASSLYSLFVPHASCGCLGAYELGPWSHTILATTMGMTALYLLVTRQVDPSPRTLLEAGRWRSAKIE